MTIVNRRNAVVGWLVWNVGKRALRRKVRAAVASIDLDAKRPNKPALVAALATLGIGAWLARHYLEEQGGDVVDVD